MEKGKRGKREVLVIVAHPDDEIIWMGGTLLRNRGRWNTTIISLCRKKDKDRAPKFRRVCGILKAKGHMSDLEDEKLTDISSEEIIKRIKKFIKKNYDYIFTHGKNGEYGHKRHIDVYKAVIKMLDENLLSCGKFFLFSYIKKGDQCIYDSRANKFIKLNSLEFLKKKFLIQEIYGFQKNSFEEKSCWKIEAFVEKRI